MSGAAGGAGVWAEASAWVAALARATCWRKVRRLVDIRYRVLSGGDGWGAKGWYTHMAEVGYLLDLGSRRRVDPCGGRSRRRPGRPASRRTGRPPRSRGTAPPSIAQLLAIGPSALERSWMMRSRCFVAVETADSRAIQ